jgi:DNA-binding Lrp family transcriptional regulator
MAVDPLTILFGSQARVKLLRFFLFNPSKDFTFDEISRRAKLVRRTARTEIASLERAGVIKKKQIYIQLPGKNKKTRAHGYALNKNFPELQALQTFLFETAPINGKTLLRHLRKAGTLDFVCVAGVFVRDFEQRLDVLLAMPKLPENKVENAIRALEAELGIEIRFAAFTSEDLLYRVGMYDKLTRDVFDYKHEILVDKIGIRDEIRRG